MTSYDRLFNTGATLRIKTNFYENDNGQPGDLLQANRLILGESYFVKISAADLRPTPAGVIGLALDIAWSGAHLEELDDPFAPSDPASPLVTQAFTLFPHPAMRSYF